jgi:hypothetical protein
MSRIEKIVSDILLSIAAVCLLIGTLCAIPTDVYANPKPNCTSPSCKYADNCDCKCNPSTSVCEINMTAQTCGPCNG